MKTAIVLWLFISICGLIIVHAGYNKRDAESQGISGIQPLEDTREKIKKIMISNIEMFKMSQILFSFVYVTMSAKIDVNLGKHLNNTRLIVNKGTKNFEDVGHCFEHAANKSHEIKQAAQVECAECYHTIINKFLGTFNVSEKVLKIGEATLYDIEKYFDTCAIILFHKHDCMNQMKQRSVNRAKDFNKKYELYVKYRKRISERITSEFLLCFKRKIRKYNLAVEHLYADVENCVKDVTQDEKK
ncbi:hypothetical protein KM043_018578 [Ampulex compressa]|nr:hypothetical protein KM043_018578 [Ampulex compressa]